MQRNVVLLAPKTKSQMNFFAQFIPQYLLTKRSLTIMVTSTAAFAFFFVMIYKPFNVEHWAEVSRFVFAACVLGIVLLGMSIAAISRVIMCYYAKKHRITYLQYIAWVGVELVLMSVAFTICSTLTGVQLDIAEAFEKSLLNTSLILLIPYIISITAFTLQDLSVVIPSSLPLVHAFFIKNNACTQTNTITAKISKNIKPSDLKSENILSLLCFYGFPLFFIIISFHK